MLWLVAYAVAIAVGQQAHACVFPVTATLLNFGWEANFACSRVVHSRLQRAIYVGWLLLDSVLLLQALCYGAAEQSNDLLRIYWMWFLGAGVAASIAGHRALYRAFAEPYLQAYAANLIMSCLFVARVASPPTIVAVSLAVGWLKLLGTLSISIANTVSWWTLRRVPIGPQLMMLVVLALDVTYIVLQAR